ncbi:quinolinate synthase [Eubacterium pyruvativorans]|uniref:quinolinate synthase n=1 Tax=Eubacterium pyruvativorans TaxID=155865 RepID=UPI0013D2E29F|nr:quinolinate synthase [Eubacterium pyruvativorans]
MNEELIREIQELKKEKDAVILAHYYVDGSIQEIADYVGDSFALAKAAVEDPRKTIVFCGVTFMGQSASILNPDKTVLVPADDAVCPMALMVDPAEIREMREKYEDLAVVCYINSMAETKALVDVCVTSSNAVKIVRSLPQKNIYFIPDQNLGSYIAEQVPEKNIMLGYGFCHVHHYMDPEDVKARSIIELADYVGSTKGIIRYSAESPETEFIICTESGVEHELRRLSPEKEFYFAANQICPNMKKLTLEKVRDCLKNGAPVSKVDEETRTKALIPLNRMLELGSAPEKKEN